MPVFGLWSVPDLGYLTYYIAAKLVNGEITGARRDVHGPGPQRRPAVHDRREQLVVLGPPFVFDKDNIDDILRTSRSATGLRR